MPNPKRTGKALVVLVTCASYKEAVRIVRALLEARFIACGTVLPEVRSFYWWEGRKQESTEALMILKTTNGKWKRMLETVRALHSYDVPEIIALPVVRGHSPYLSWIFRETSVSSRLTYSRRAQTP